jgi:hypothetical protein
MGVSTTDTKNVALYDDTTGYAFGPVFASEEHAEDFLRYCRERIGVDDVRTDMHRVGGWSQALKRWNTARVDPETGYLLDERDDGLDAEPPMPPLCPHCNCEKDKPKHMTDDSYASFTCPHPFHFREDEPEREVAVEDRLRARGWHELPNGLWTADGVEVPMSLSGAAKVLAAMEKGSKPGEDPQDGAMDGVLLGSLQGKPDDAERGKRLDERKDAAQARAESPLKKVARVWDQTSVPPTPGG